MKRVIVVGSSGFVGRATCRALIEDGLRPIALKAPRLRAAESEVHQFAIRQQSLVGALAGSMAGADAVVCAAGLPDASSRDTEALFGANAALPGVVAAAAALAEVPRLVHVSSAVVQGAMPRLDDSPNVSPTSVYGRSKAAGEEIVLGGPRPESTVIYRPPSVHSPDRRITQAIYRIANSPASSVVGPGDRPTPQAHIVNVASALVHLATTTDSPPPIVIHPWEGWTTKSFLELFGQGKTPRSIPTPWTGAISLVLRRLLASDALAPNARRLEMLWYGQGQAQSWLTDQGWIGPAAQDGWALLVRGTARALGNRGYTVP